MQAVWRGNVCQCGRCENADGVRILRSGGTMLPLAPAHARDARVWESRRPLELRKKSSRAAQALRRARHAQRGSSTTIRRTIRRRQQRVSTALWASSRALVPQPAKTVLLGPGRGKGPPVPLKTASRVRATHGAPRAARATKCAACVGMAFTEAVVSAKSAPKAATQPRERLRQRVSA